MSTALPPDDEYAAAGDAWPARPSSRRPDEPGRHHRADRPEPGHQPEFDGYQPFEARGYGGGNGNGSALGNGTTTLLREPERWMPADGPGSDSARPAEPESKPRRWRWLPPVPLLAVLVLQAAISLSLIWSNTAFGDEANYLWVGHLELSYWFGGGPVPHFNVLSGTPEIYPPIGALASAIGGLAAARALSLIFMLGATALLYSAASRLLGTRAAIAAAVLWAVSVSALKLGAFATFDPMAIFLVCLATWIAVQAGYRSHPRALAALAGAVLLVGNLTAYSYGIYDAPVIVFAFCVWWLRYDRRRAFALTLWLVGPLILLALIVVTALGMWHNILLTTVRRNGANKTHQLQGYLTVVELAWEWAGLVAILAAGGAIAAAASRVNKRLTLVLIVLAATAFLVPLYQLHLRTAWALDKHIAVGMWLAAMPAGYLVASVARMPRPRVAVAALTGVAAAVFPTVAGWTAVYSDYHSWANSSQLIRMVRPLVETKHSGVMWDGNTYATILSYYTGTESRGPGWDTGSLPTTTPSIPKKGWQSYFKSELATHKFSIIALDLPVNRTAFPKRAAELQSRKKIEGILSYLSTPANLGLFELAGDVEASSDYKLVGIASYSDDLGPGSYLVWRRVPAGHRKASAARSAH